MGTTSRTMVLVLALTALVASACQFDARESDRILQQSACDKLRHLGTASNEYAQGVVSEQWRLRQHAENIRGLTELSDELRQSRFGEPLGEYRDRVDRAFVTQNMVGADQREGAPPWAAIAADAEALWEQFDCPSDEFETVTAVAVPSPAVECRELGGGWRWEGSHDRGTTSIGLGIDRDALEAGTGEGSVTTPRVDDAEWAERLEDRAAAGWTDERVRRLSYLGVDHRIATERGFDGDRAEFAEVQEDLGQRLDESPRCAESGAEPPAG